MWISALSVYELQFADPTQWAEAFAERPSDDPAIGLRKQLGFATMEFSGSYVDVVGQFYAFNAVLTERVLPKEAIEREVRRRMPANDQGDEEKVRSSWVQVEADLLANAPVRERRVPAVYDASSCRLYVFGTSSQAEDCVLRAMRDVLGTVHASPVVPREPVGAAMTRWMKEGAAPTPLLLGRSVELESEDETGGKAAFRNRDISINEIRQHIENGDTVCRLSLLWNGQLEFSLNARGEIKQIGPPDCKAKPQHMFDSDWVGMMDKAPQFFSDVIGLLGGSLVGGEAMRVQERAVVFGVLATGKEQDVGPLVSAMDKIAADRNISEMIIPGLPEPLMRRVYSYWANGKGTKVVLIKPAPDDPAELAKAILKNKPKVLMLWGACPRIEAIAAAAAQAKKVEVMRLEDLAA